MDMFDECFGSWLATKFSLEMPFISGESELIIGRQPYLLGVSEFLFLEAPNS